MRIAQVAPLYESVPPRGYGGTERVVSYLTEALVGLGHDVTLFASGDSVTGARLQAVVPRSLRPDPRKPDPLVWHTILMDTVFESEDEFDVIHFHTDALHLPLVNRCHTPCVSTLHGRLDLPDVQPLFQRFYDHPLVSISESQRNPLKWANWHATVHHGLPLPLYAFHPKAQDYFAFVGRISPEKRVDRAIEIAVACGTRLRIAAKIDPADEQYWRSIAHLFDHPLVEFVGEIGDAAKGEFIGNARALLMPIDWPEPFGLVMIEALACGTPVIAWRNGSVPEVVEHGVTGAIVGSMDEAIAAARAAGDFDRTRCREAFERRFCADVMARNYLAAYGRLIDQQADRPAAGLPPIAALADPVWRGAAAVGLGAVP
jgi:glycosyltransferase involved in cell wall biosynthesis